MNNSEQRINKKGDHLPKISNSETVHKVAEILKNNSEGVLYDRPEDDGQSLLAHKTPGSVIAAQKHKGLPSWKRHSGD